MASFQRNSYLFKIPKELSADELHEVYDLHQNSGCGWEGREQGSQGRQIHPSRVWLTLGDGYMRGDYMTLSVLQIFVIVPLKS